jgi:hypothetical protein
MTTGSMLVALVVLCLILSFVSYLALHALGTVIKHDQQSALIITRLSAALSLYEGALRQSGAASPEMLEIMPAEKNEAA